jgi:hypothetical protein
MRAVAAALNSIGPSGESAAAVQAGKVPTPGTVPKLPQTIFNLEKKAGSGNSGRVRRSGQK